MDEFDELDKKIDKTADDLGVELESKKREDRQKEVMGAGASAGVEFAAAIIFCTLFGIWLDKQFETKPILMFIFIILGACVAFYNLYRASQDL